MKHMRTAVKRTEKMRAKQTKRHEFCARKMEEKKRKTNYKIESSILILTPPSLSSTTIERSLQYANGIWHGIGALIYIHFFATLNAFLYYFSFFFFFLLFFVQLQRQIDDNSFKMYANFAQRQEAIRVILAKILVVQTFSVCFSSHRSFVGKFSAQKLNCNWTNRDLFSLMQIKKLCIEREIKRNDFCASFFPSLSFLTLLFCVRICPILRLSLKQ